MRITYLCIGFISLVLAVIELSYHFYQPPLSFVSYCLLFKIF